MAAQQTLILDNGAYTIKAGYSNEEKPSLIPNGIFKTKSDRKRVYVGDELLEECQDRSSLFFVLPFERGYLVHWDTQLQVWNRLFDKQRLNVDFGECRLVLTDPNEIARAFAEDNAEEIVFENFRFHSLLKTSAPHCVAQAHCSRENPACLVVDSGHSFTHIVPCVQGQPVRRGLLRVDVGGKALTNQLKDWLSYRQLNVMDETYVINDHCKEDACFVSTNFQKDLAEWKAKRVDYILPDFVHLMRGQIRERGGKLKPSTSSSDTQLLSLGVERFAVPELLFHPSDVEIQQMGLVEAMATSLGRLPKALQMLLARNVVLVGGNSLFPGYRERIELDLRSSLADFFHLKVHLPPDPIGHAWECARQVLSGDDGTDHWHFGEKFVTRAEYEEQGIGSCRRRFGNNFWVEGEQWMEEEEAG